MFKGILVKLLLKTVSDAETILMKYGALHDSFFKSIKRCSHDRFEIERDVDDDSVEADDSNISYVDSGVHDVEITFSHYGLPSPKPNLKQTIVATFYDVKDDFIEFRMPTGCYLDGCIQHVCVREISETVACDDNARLVLIVQRAFCCGDWFTFSVPMFRFAWAEFEAVPG